MNSPSTREALEFAKGCVTSSGKTLISELAHFVIRDGRVRGFDGLLALCSPIDSDLSCIPEGAALLKALDRLAGQEGMNVTLKESGKLELRAGKLRIYVPCLPEAPNVEDIAPSEGEQVEIEQRDGFLPTLALMRPFIGSDQMRPWCTGVLLKDQSMVATNNLSMLEHQSMTVWPRETILPKRTIDELLRIGSAPDYFTRTDSSITFHYREHGQWLRSQLINSAWPDAWPRIVAAAGYDTFDPAVLETMSNLQPFLHDNKHVSFTDNEILTHAKEAETGAIVEATAAWRGETNYDELMRWGELQPTSLHVGDRALHFAGRSAHGSYRGALALTHAA